MGALNRRCHNQGKEKKIQHRKKKKNEFRGQIKRKKGLKKKLHGHNKMTEDGKPNQMTDEEMLSLVEK